MHGLINRALQFFIRDTYGQDVWANTARAAGLEFFEFEAMLHYDDALTGRVIDAATAAMGIPRDTFLEDLGTYLVTHPNVEAVRRLLRFSGNSFVDFLHTLDDLKDRARLAVEDLELPNLELRDHGCNVFSLNCSHAYDGFGYVLMGLLRAMADDYGALVLLDFSASHTGSETINITLVESNYARGRDFQLGVTS